LSFSLFFKNKSLTFFEFCQLQRKEKPSKTGKGPKKPDDTYIGIEKLYRVFGNNPVFIDGIAGAT